jgi:glutathione-regulated potassium-efflux system ancillary protein KefC
VRRFGWEAFYGDATRLDLLRVAGADKARVLVLAIDDIDQSLKRSPSSPASTSRS